MTSRAPAGKQPQHPFGEGIADEKVRFGIAKFVVTVAGVWRVFRLADKFVRRDKEDIARELRPRGGGSLSFAEGGPCAGCLHPGSCQLANDNGQSMGVQFSA